MIAKTPLVASLALLVAGYAAYPCLTLYRLDTALRDHDAGTLGRLVDWPSVRAGLQQDIAGGQTQPADELPAFGTSFIRHIAARTVQAGVTPEGVLTRLQDTGSTHPPMHLRSAYFEGPTRFVVALGERDGRTIRLQLALQGGGWMLTRVSVPRAMLTGSDKNG